MPADAALVDAQIDGQRRLPWKAEIVVPGVAKDHRHRQLVPSAQRIGFQNEIRDLGEALCGDRIGPLEDNVPLSDEFTDAATVRVLHSSLFYLAGSRRPAVIPYPSAAVSSGMSVCRIGRAASPRRSGCGSIGMWFCKRSIKML